MDNQTKGRYRRAGCAGIVLLLTVGCTLLVTQCRRTQPMSEIAETAPVTEAVTETTLPPETTEPVTETQTETAAVQEDPGWELRLVNSTHPVPAEFDIELTELSNGVSVDSRMYPALQEMFDEMRAQGLNPFVREGFRTRAYQEEILEERRQEYLAQGYEEQEADALAREYVAEPGTSEHELGLAVDINAAGESDGWDVYNWLAEHAPEYGFILRYPEGKQEITGIAYEPWHYRYVGITAAEEITREGITLEEYLSEESQKEDRS